MDFETRAMISGKADDNQNIGSENITWAVMCASAGAKKSIMPGRNYNVTIRIVVEEMEANNG